MANASIRSTYTLDPQTARNIKMNPDISKLWPYPFERLAELKAGVTPPADKPHIALSIGEPKHPPPAFVVEAFKESLAGLGRYPDAKGIPELREACVAWLARRYRLPDGLLDPARHVLPVGGTREGLFAFAQAVVARDAQPIVMLPNPFYQIYEGAALLAGAEPYYVNAVRDNGFLPDLDAVPERIWRRCQLLYLCSPGNPSGAVMDADYLERVLELADRHDFIIAADECYTEIYLDEDAPPAGLLEVCQRLGRDDFRRCVAFHSLSKRSNVPGMRSGFVAGDADILAAFLSYRTYHGAAAALPVQAASIAAWNDDRHVVENRRLYREKFAQAVAILKPVMDVDAPAGAFYLWAPTPIDDERFARELFAQENLTVLPGRYLARQTPRGNPGENHVRISLVPELSECRTAAERMRDFIERL
jgi:N-succinyldiaminopimelate aminotransferase